MKPYMKPYRILPLLLGIGIGVGGACAASDRIYFQGPKEPLKLFAISQGDMDPGEMLMVTTTQGVLAKKEPLIYISANGSYEAWSDELKAKGVGISNFDDPWALMKAILPGLETKGYILADLGTPSVNAGTTAAGILDLPVICGEQVEKAKALGLKMVLDVRGKDAQWAFRTYKDKLNRGMLFRQDPEKPHLRDYAVFNNALVFYNEPQAFIEEAMSWVQPDSPLIGWGPGGEDQHVGLGGKHGMFTVPADWALDISTLSAFRGSGLKQGVGARELAPQPDPEGTKAHYVAFVMTDGDNVQWLLGGLYHDPRWYGSPFRGNFPMAWTMAPELADLAPPVMKAYYGSAISDTFVAGVSGAGYMYPSTNPDIGKHLANLGSYLQKADMRIVSVMDHGSFRNRRIQDALAGYAALEQVKAGIYVNYNDYAGDKGTIGWLNGKPFATARYKLWEGDPLKMAADINKLSTDVTGSRAYTLIWVHAWSHTLEDVQTVVNNLQPHVKVVGIDEFFGRIMGNLKP